MGQQPVRPGPEGGARGQDRICDTGELFRHQLLRRQRQVNERRADVQHVLVLSPEEGPVVLVLEEVRVEHQDAGDDAAGDEAEVGAVDSIGHLFRDGPDGRHERGVRVRVAAKDVV